MKIGIIVPSLNTGGAERTAVSLANWLASNTNDQIYLINLGKDDGNYTINEKVNYFQKKKSSGLFSKIKNSYDVIKYIKSLKLDIIFEMLYSPLKYCIISKICNRKLKIIGSERSNPDRHPIKSKIVPHLCNGYIFQTKAVKNFFSNSIRKKSVVINNALINPDIENIKISNNKKKVIISVGRLNHIKGHDILIQAFNKVKDKHPEYQLHIYGEGEDRKDIEKLINDLNLSKYVKLFGNSKNVLSKVNECEIYVLASRYEGMPNSLLEAMAIGMPCITTRSFYGIDEVVKDNENILLVEKENIDELYKSINLLIENEKLRTKISQNAINVRKNYSTDKIFKQYYDYLKSFKK